MRVKVTKRDDGTFDVSALGDRRHKHKQVHEKRVKKGDIGATVEELVDALGGVKGDGPDGGGSS